MNLLVENINITVESIKGSIQQSNAEAIELSADDFKKFVLDIMDVMKAIEGVSGEGENSSPMLGSIIQTLSLFTDNAELTIEGLINKVKDSVILDQQSFVGVWGKMCSMETLSF